MALHLQHEVSTSYPQTSGSIYLYSIMATVGFHF